MSTDIQASVASTQDDEPQESCKCGGAGWFYAWPWVEAYCLCPVGRAAEAADRKADWELWERQRAVREAGR